MSDILRTGALLRVVFYNLLLVCAGLMPLPGRAQSGVSSVPSLAEAVNPDGTLRPGVSGSFDARGYRLGTGRGGQPVFARTTNTPEWQEDFSLPGTNGSVSTVVCRGANIYVGGTFTAAGHVPASNVAWWDGTSWHALGAGTNNTVWSLALDSNGNLYAGGNFTQAGAVAVSRIARWNGTAWGSLGTGMSDRVMALVVDEQNQLYAGGDFGSAGGVTASRVARWDGTSWSSLGTGVATSNGAGAVYSLVYRQGSLYAGGNFTQAGGIPANYVARWNGSLWYPLGSARGSTYNGTNAYVQSLALDGNGTLYAAGSFTNAGGLPADHLAQWDGLAWGNVGTPPANGQSYHLTVDALGRLYVAATFTPTGGVSTCNVVRWDGSNWQNLGQVAGRADCLAPDSQQGIVLGGVFSGIGGVGAAYVAHWDGTAWQALPDPGSQGLSSTVQALAVDQQGNVYAGGDFIQAGGVGAAYVARWDGTNWSPLGTGVNGSVRALTFDSQGNLYAGGDFTQAGGVPASRVARWDGSTWTALGAGVGGRVRALVIDQQGNLYAGGEFQTIGGVAVTGIARWDGSNWSKVGAGLDGFVTALVLDSQGNLYAASSTGYFSSVSPRSSVAKWNGSTWVGLPGVLNNNASPYLAALAIDSQDNLYVLGNLNMNNGVVYNCVGKWNGSSWTVFSPQVNNNGYVGALAVDGQDNLYVGGLFTRAGSQGLSHIARWDGAAWSPLGPGLNGDVAALVVDAAGTVYAGGYFTTLADNSLVSAYFGAYGVPDLQLSSISPAAELPGQAVTLTGTGFRTGTTVSFGGVNATSVVVNSPTQLTVVVPAGAPAGTTTVVVSRGSLSTGSAPAFRVLAVYDGGAVATCESAVPAVASTSDDQWHYLLTTGNQVVAAYKYAGPSLGDLALDVLRADPAQSIRRDGTGQPYLDRNWHLTASAGRFDGRIVQLRLYGLAAELDRLYAADATATSASLKVRQYSDSGGSSENCDLADNVASAEWRVLPAAITTYPAGTGYFVAELAVNDHFSEFYLVGPAAPLPVQLTGFTAQAEGGAVRLAWTTASEINSARFEVERSEDGVTFGRVGAVAAAGSSTQLRQYTYRDARVPAGRLYYRLRQVDLDQTAHYSPVRVVQGTGNSLSLFPNPTSGGSTLAGAVPGTAVRVLDALGRVAATATADAAGTASLPGSLVPGVYVVRSGTQAVRLVVR